MQINETDPVKQEENALTYIFYLTRIQPSGITAVCSIKSAVYRTFDCESVSLRQITVEKGETH